MNGRSVLLSAIVVAAILAFVPVAMAGSGAAAATDALQSAGHAACLFAIVWIIASLRIRRSHGRWSLGFELSPLRQLDLSNGSTTDPKEKTL